MADDATQRARDQGVKRVLWIVLLLNLGVALVKYLVSVATGSVSLFADSIHSSLDGLSNVVGLVGVAVASRPADANHPYGHRRFESLAAAAIGVLTAAGAWKIGGTVVDALRGVRAAPHIAWSDASVVVGTVVVNLFITRYERARGVALKSPTLIADANHTFSDLLGSLVVLVSFAATWIHIPYADVVAAIVVLILIAHTGYRTISDNARSLSDEARLDTAVVTKIAEGIERVRRAHGVRSRGVPDYVLVDLTVDVDETMSVSSGHDVAHAVADAIRQALPEVKDVVVHVEPWIPPT